MKMEEVNHEYDENSRNTVPGQQQPCDNMTTKNDADSFNLSYN